MSLYNFRHKSMYSFIYYIPIASLVINLILCIDNKLCPVTSSCVPETHIYTHTHQIHKWFDF